MLVIALFMFLGFDSTAQSYKPIPEAITIVSNTVNQSQSTKAVQRNSYQNTQATASNGMKVLIGQALLGQFKNNVDVEKALNNVAAQVVLDSRRATYKAEAISFYRNLLLL